MTLDQKLWLEGFRFGVIIGFFLGVMACVSMLIWVQQGS